MKTAYENSYGRRDRLIIKTDGQRDPPKPAPNAYNKTNGITTKANYNSL